MNNKSSKTRMNNNSSQSSNEVRYDDPIRVAQETLEELEWAKEQGLFGVWRMRWEAWIEAMVAKPLIRKMETRQKLLSARRDLVETGMGLVNESEHARRDIERHRATYAEVQRQRILAETGVHAIGSYTPTSNVTPPEPPLRPYVTDEQINAVALRFLAQFPLGADFDTSWDIFVQRACASLPSQILTEAREWARQMAAQR